MLAQHNIQKSVNNNQLKSEYGDFGVISFAVIRNDPSYTFYITQGLECCAIMELLVKYDFPINFHFRCKLFNSFEKVDDEILNLHNEYFRLKDSVPVVSHASTFSKVDKVQPSKIFEKKVPGKNQIDLSMLKERAKNQQKERLNQRIIQNMKQNVNESTKKKNKTISLSKKKNISKKTFEAKKISDYKNIHASENESFQSSNNKGSLVERALIISKQKNYREN